MKNYFKRSISVFLVVLMVLSLVITGAAAGNQQQNHPTHPNHTNNYVTYSVDGNMQDAMFVQESFWTNEAAGEGRVHLTFDGVSFIRPSSKVAEADVVILLDTTGSMASDMGNAKRAINDMASYVLTQNPGSRVGFIHPSLNGTMRVLSNLTSNLSSFQSAVNGASGDVDGEWYHRLFASAKQMLDTQSSSSRAKLIIIVGDGQDFEYDRYSYSNGTVFCYKGEDVYANGTTMFRVSDNANLGSIDVGTRNVLAASGIRADDNITIASLKFGSRTQYVDMQRIASPGAYYNTTLDYTSFAENLIITINEQLATRVVTLETVIDGRYFTVDTAKLDAQIATLSGKCTYTITNVAAGQKVTMLYSALGKQSIIEDVYIPVTIKSGIPAAAFAVDSGWLPVVADAGTVMGAAGCVYEDIYGVEQDIRATQVYLDASLHIPTTVTLTFDPNGGSVSPTSATAAIGQPYGTLPTPTRTGYNFNGWFTSATGGSQVTATSIVPMSDHTLYAQWTVANTTLTLDPQGGTVSPTSVTVTPGQPYGTLPTPTRTSYGFDGWFTAATGGTQVTAASTVPMGNHTLYAQWTIQTYTITFNPAGGTGSTTTQVATFGVAAPLNPGTEPVRTGYLLSGWKADPYGTTSDYKTGDSIVDLGNITLYAHWIAVTDVLEVKGDGIRVLLGEWSGNISTTLTYYIRLDGAPITAAEADRLTFKLQTHSDFAGLTAREPVTYSVDTFASLAKSGGDVVYTYAGVETIDGKDYGKIEISATMLKSGVVRVSCGFDEVYTSEGYYDLVTPGDVDANGRITASDYGIVQRAVNGIAGMPESGEHHRYQLELYDMDGNKRINASDYAVILRMINRIIPSN